MPKIKLDLEFWLAVFLFLGAFPLILAWVIMEVAFKNSRTQRRT